MKFSLFKSKRKRIRRKRSVINDSVAPHEASGDFRAAGHSASGRAPLKIGAYPYTLQHELGQTNMSCTWRALENKREVVLKIARWDQDDQFKRNQRAIDNEEHWLRLLQGNATAEQNGGARNSVGRNNAGQGNIGQEGLVTLLPIAGSGQRPIYSAKTEENGNPRFISLVYMPGGSLQNLVQHAGKLPVKQALHILNLLAETLRFIHRNGCVHLDIKPDNIMFRQPVTEKSNLKDVQPVIIDFGIAGEMATKQYVGGVARWLSPECFVAKELVEKTILHPGMDIYPLGLLLHYMLTGVLPKPNVIPDAIEPAMLRRDPTVPKRYQKQLASELNQFIQMMLVRDLDKRPRAKVVSRYAQLLMHERTDAKALGQTDAASPAETDSIPLRNVWSEEKPFFTKRMRAAGMIVSMVGVLIVSGFLLLELGRSSPSGSRDAMAQGVDNQQSVDEQQRVPQKAEVQEVAFSPTTDLASAAMVTVAQVVTSSVNITTEVVPTSGITPTSASAISNTNSAALDTAMVDSALIATPDRSTDSVASGAVDARATAQSEAISVINELSRSSTVTTSLAAPSAEPITATELVTATDLLTGTSAAVGSAFIGATSQPTATLIARITPVITTTLVTRSTPVTTPVTTTTLAARIISVTTTAPSTPVLPTATIQPTETTQQIETVLSTATPVPTYTSTPTLIAPPTSTLIPLQSTPTTLATQVSTRIATAVATAQVQVPTTVPTRVPTSTATPFATQIAIQPTATSSVISVALIRPENGAEGTERVDFAWSPTGQLGSNEYFEVAFWQAGKDPQIHAFGVIGAGPYTSTTVNLKKLATNRPDLLLPANDYLWGVWVVRASDGKRLRLVSEVRTLSYMGSSKSRSN